MAATRQAQLNKLTEIRNAEMQAVKVLRARDVLVREIRTLYSMRPGTGIGVVCQATSILHELERELWGKSCGHEADGADRTNHP
jgi:hypothetical protein